MVDDRLSENYYQMGTGIGTLRVSEQPSKRALISPMVATMIGNMNTSTFKNNFFDTMLPP